MQKLYFNLLVIFITLSFVMSAFGQIDAGRDRYAGFLEPQKTAVLGMIVEGVIADIHARPQDIVEKDAVLIKLDDRQYILEKETVQTDLEILREITREDARIRLQYSKDNLEIVRRLYNLDPNEHGGTRVASEKELKEATQSYEIAQTKLESIDLEEKKLQIRLDRINEILDQHVLKAPFDGVIVPFSSVETLKGQNLKKAEVGEIVSRQKPVMAMMKVARLRLRRILPKSDLGKVYLGQKARVFVDGAGNEAIPATVVYISPTVTSVDNFDIKVEFDNPRIADTDRKADSYPYRFRPGMRARVELDFKQ